MNIGDRFGRLVVIGERFVPEGKSRPHVYFECDCGQICHKAIYDVRGGQTRSCGCFAKEASSERESTHRMSGGPEYNVWKGVKQRCYNPNHTHYSSYGGRGIDMCQRWKDSFEAFYEDMGPRPQGKSLDRIDNSLGYSKENCRWVTQTTQARNTRANRIVSYGGKEMTVKELSEIAVVDYQTLLWRISRGWGINRAVTEPSRNPNNRVNRRKPK